MFGTLTMSPSNAIGKWMIHFQVLLLLLGSSGSESKKVLFYYPMMSKSILFTFAPLAQELGQRGHEVFIVSPYSIGLRNVTEIVCDTEELFPMAANLASKSVLQGESMFKLFSIMMPPLLALARESLTNDAMSKWIADPSTEFDAVISDTGYINAIGVYLAHRFNASLVLYCTKMMSSVEMNEALLQPHNPAFMPHPLHKYGTQMNFKERVINVLLHWLHSVLSYWMTVPHVETILDEYIPDPPPERRPKISELIKSPSLALHLGHSLILDGYRPTMPNFVQIGMLNCHPIDYKKSMDVKLREIMDNAKHGVIFISFGTFVKSSEMKPEDIQTFLNVFSKLKETVIWKWETESMEGAPKNLHLFKWLPQKEILAHPKLKLFITHGGQASYQEILCFKKPALFMPIRSDQFTNSEDGRVKGLGLVLPYSDITEDNFYASLQEMLQDPKYASNAQYWGSLIMDEKEHPMQRAIWWIEYVMRNKPVRHFKSPGSELNAFQLNLLDVYSFLGLIFLSFWYLTYRILKCIYSLLSFCFKKKKKVD